MQTYAFARISGAGPIGDLGEEPAPGSGTVSIFDALQRVLFRSEGDVVDGTYSYRATDGQHASDRGEIRVGNGSGITVTPARGAISDPINESEQGE